MKIRQFLLGETMEEENVQAVEEQEAVIPFGFYAKITFVLAAVALAVGCLGILGLLELPQVDFLSHSRSWYYTSFGGALGAVFIISGYFFHKRAQAYEPADQVIAKSYTIKRNNNELRIVTRRFQQRVDLLNALTKEQKFECLESGQWALHEEGENEHYIIGKFCYLVNGEEEKRCRVRLKVLPMKESARTTNVYYNKRKNRLFLMQNGEPVPFRGDTANSYLMQKAWLFSCNNFDSMISA